jgi:transposase
MSKHYDNEFKKEVVNEYLKGKKSMQEIASEYNVSRSTISGWIDKLSDECQYTTSSTDESLAKEVRRLNKELKEKEKEIEFLKKATAFFAKELD